MDEFREVTRGRIESVSLDDAGVIRPFPVQVDGDYIGDAAGLDIDIQPGALTVVPSPGSNPIRTRWARSSLDIIAGGANRNRR